jgi:hypothetical protein
LFSCYSVIQTLKFIESFKSGLIFYFYFHFREIWVSNSHSRFFIDDALWENFKSFSIFSSNFRSYGFMQSSLKIKDPPSLITSPNSKKRGKSENWEKKLFSILNHSQTKKNQRNKLKFNLNFDERMKVTHFASIKYFRWQLSL